MRAIPNSWLTVRASLIVYPQGAQSIRRFEFPRSNFVSKSGPSPDNRRSALLSTERRHAGRWDHAEQISIKRRSRQEFDDNVKILTKLRALAWGAQSICRFQFP